MIFERVQWIIFCLTISGLIFFVKGTSVVEDILKLKLDGDLMVTLECKSVLRELQEALLNKELWVVKLLDTSGRIESNFVAGNNYWLGSKASCLGLNQALTLKDMNLSNRYLRYSHPNLTVTTAPFVIKYHVTYVEHRSEYQLDHGMYKENIIHIGSCLPNSCSSKDVTELMNEILDDNFEQYRIIGKNYEVLYTKTLDSSLKPLTKTWYFITLIVYITFCLFLSIFSLFFRENHSETQSEKVYSLIPSDKFPPITRDIFACFSIKDNLKTIFDMKESEKDPLKAVIHGLRTFSATYLVLTHIGYFAIYIIDNSREGLKHINDISFIPFVNSPMLIDNYFAMSGFLLGLGVINVRKESVGSLRIFGDGSLCRYLRIMIPYIPALLIFMTLATYFEQASPYLTFILDQENCHNYWWRNALLINNLFPFNEICYVTTWYLASDFQLYIIVLAFLALRNTFPKTGSHLLKLLFIFGLCLSASIGYKNNFSFYINVQISMINITYFPSWTHICPYLIGVGGAFIYTKLKHEKFVLNAFLMHFLWVCNVTLAIGLYFSQTFYREDDPWFGAFSLSLGRALWSFTIVWLIVTTALGYGGIIGRVFSQKWFIPISRISYSICLVNQLVLFGFGMAADKPFHYDIPMNIIIFIGYGILIAVVSLIFNLIFEFPFVRLMKVLRQNLK